MSSSFQMGDLVITLQMTVTPVSHMDEGQDGHSSLSTRQKERLGWIKPSCLHQLSTLSSHFTGPTGRRAAGFLCWDVLPREPGWQHVGPHIPRTLQSLSSGL